MINVYVTSRIEYLALEPLITNMRDKGVRYIVYFSKELFHEYGALYNSSKLEERGTQRMAKYIHALLLILFTKRSFSDQYRRMIFGHYLMKRNAKSLLYLVSLIVPGVSRINSFLHRIVGVLTRKQENNTVILVASLNRVPHLCCGKRNVITVMESWDHAMKIPNGYLSKYVYVWNNDLASDWSTFQKDRSVNVGYPWKLSYAIDNNHSNDKMLFSKVVYACAFSDEFSRNGFLESERWFVSLLAGVVKDLGLELFIKPRPLSSKREEEYWQSLGDHVSVGTYSLSGSDASNYNLSDDYNLKRFEEIDDARVVINCYTTFGLDAVLYGKNVAQFDLSQVNQTAQVINDNHHIKKYLNAFDGVYKPIDLKDIQVLLKDACSVNSSNALVYSQKLRGWIEPRCTKEMKIEEIISSCESLFD